MTRPRGIWARTPPLALAGAAGFWLTNFAISLTPVAAEYRAALGISYGPMLLQALLGGLVVGFVVSFCLLRFPNWLPTTGPLVQAVLWSVVALVVVTLLVEVPPRVLATTNTAPRYLVIAVAINILRFLALGLVVGLLHSRSRDRAGERTPPNAQHPPV